jgi:hypothetical protein
LFQTVQGTSFLLLKWRKRNQGTFAKEAMTKLNTLQQPGTTNTSMMLGWYRLQVPKWGNSEISGFL